jgi:hypothetical protein
MTTPTEDQVNIALEMLKARHAKPKQDPNKQYPYRLIHFDDLRPGTKSAYLVDGVIPRAGIVAVWGPPKSGKSFWTFDLVMHIALGWPYRGRRVERGPVAYLAFEGAEGFNNRAEAFRRTHEIAADDRPWFYLLASNAKLVRDHKALIASIDGQMLDRPPTVVVLDTLNRSIDGSESKDLDMGQYLAAAEVIGNEFDCVVIIVHHSGIDDSRPRGHTSLTGTAAAQLSVKRDAASRVVVEVEAMKDGAEGAGFVSALKVIEVGVDDAGQPITSCVIEAVEHAAPITTSRPKLTANQSRFVDILREAVLDAPDDHKTTANIPGGCTAISREWLKMCCAAKGWVENDGSSRSRAKVSEMINALAGKRIIGTTNLYVWVP